MLRTSTGPTGGRPMILATRGVVSAGHYLAAEAGLGVLRWGGNAMDAAAAAGFALHVVAPNQNGFAGEAPMLVYSAKEGKHWALSGHGAAPRAATIEAYRALGLEVIPGDGLLPAVVPSAVAGWILLLRRFGALRLHEVLAPAIDLADNGFVMFDHLHGTIAAHAERFRREWPSSAEVFLPLPGGGPPKVGHIWRQGDLAGSLRALARADRRYRKRDDGLRAAHDAFYRGPMARRIARFCRSTAVRDATCTAHAGYLTEEDLADHEAQLEEPASTTYRGLRVHKCGTWTQGPAMLQGLNLLEGFDLKGMGHNSADYIHTVVECMKLAYADREFHYGDPAFVHVPLRRLLGKAYADQRRKLVDPARASLELRPGGMAAISAATIRDVERCFAVRLTGGGPVPGSGDTTAVQAVDAAGNIVSAVPSGGWLMASPVIPGLGFPLGTRGQMFCLTPGHPNCLAPGKRPRTTLTPTLVGKGSRPAHMAFASPGGDSQDQWNLQFLLNVAEFGMSLQEAAEAPMVTTNHFPSSFYPRAAAPGSLHLESRVGEAVRAELARRGHVVRVAEPWSQGSTMAVGRDHKTGALHGAASPRYNPAYAAGW